MLTKTLAAALCASAAVAVDLEAESEVNVSFGDTVNTSVSNDSKLSNMTVGFAAEDYLGCWKEEGTGKAKWYNNNRMHIFDNWTWYCDEYKGVKMTWAWNPDHISAEDPGQSYSDWHFKRDYDEDGRDMLYILPNHRWCSGDCTAQLFRCEDL